MSKHIKTILGIYIVTIILSSCTTPESELSSYEEDINEASSLIKTARSVTSMSEELKACRGVRRVNMISEGGVEQTAYVVDKGVGDEGRISPPCRLGPLLTEDSFRAQSGMTAQTYDRLTRVLDQTDLWEVETYDGGVSAYVRSPSLEGTYIRTELGGRAVGRGPGPYHHIRDQWYWEHAD